MGIGRGMRRRSFASEGRFGEAEPVGCASIRERVDTCRTCRLGGESIVSRKGIMQNELSFKCRKASFFDN